MTDIGPKTFFEGLLGGRAAINQLASSSAVLPAGILFALSAGFAREYDGAYLVREPWHALLPLGISAITGTLFWCAFFRPWRGTGPKWTAFLGLFWMSAPLAWLYAVPYERFLEPLSAFKANLWTLAVVSVWRVAWITRVLSVLRAAPVGSTLAGVLLLADVAVMTISYLAPQPVVSFMGGVRGSVLETAIGNTNQLLLVFSTLALPVLGIAALVLRSFRAGDVPARSTEAPGAGSLLRFSLLAVLACVPLILWAQPEQARRWSTERDLRSGDIRAALEAMSSRGPDDYPPGWDPPPHRYLGDGLPEIGRVLDVILDQPVAPWVAERFVPKFFHVYYTEGDSPRSVLEGQLAFRAEHEGEERARRLLELLSAHSGTLNEPQRGAVKELMERVRDGSGFASSPDATAQ